MAKESLFNLRFQAATGQLESHGRLTAVRRDIARIYTIMRERELGITTIVNLHFLDLAKVYGERIIGLRACELVYDGTGAAADEHVFRDIYGRSLTADDVMGAAETQPATIGAGRIGASSNRNDTNIGNMASKAPAGAGTPTKKSGTPAALAARLSTLNRASRITQQTAKISTAIQPALRRSCKAKR